MKSSSNGDQQAESVEELDELQRSSKTVKENPRDPMEITMGEMSGKTSYNDKDMGSIPGAFEQALQIERNVEDDS